MPVLNNQVLLERALELDQSGPYHFAEPIDISLNPNTSGTWEILADGRYLWRLRIHSATAHSLNLGFTQYYLPPEGRLFVYSSDYKTVIGPFTAKDNRNYGQLWTPIIASDEIVIEVNLPGKLINDLELQLTKVNHGFRPLGSSSTRQGDCNIDVICPEGDPWRDQIRSVGVYTVNGIWTCTGTLVNNTSEDLTPYFLTANHCGLNSSNDGSVVVYWNFESSICGNLSGGSLNQFTNGAIFRASRTDVDMALIELSEVPNSAYNVYYSGWDRSVSPALGSVGIHHPSTDEKAISFNDDQLTTGNSCIGSGGSSTHWWVDNWELGTTEPGSSGSGLWNPANKLLVGFLSGGQASCSSPEQYDCYGKFSTAWDLGSTAATRLEDWLDPLGTNPSTLPGYDTMPPCSGSPTAGTIEPANPVACSGNPVMLRLINYTIAGGISFEWEESDDNGGSDPWETITGAADSYYTTPPLSSPKWYRAKVICTNSSLSDYSPSVQVTIQSGGLPVPFSEGFETAVPPTNCWTQEFVVESLDWRQAASSSGSHPSQPHAGSYFAILQVAEYGDHITKLVSPAINFNNNILNTQLTFWHYMEYWPSDQDELRIYYKSSAAAGWTLLAEYTNNVNAWTQRTISLPDPSNDYYLAFEGNAKYGYGVCIDDVQITGEPAPCQITELTASTQTPCDPLTNSYSQQVVVTYEHEPETGTLDVNGQSFSIDVSPQTVTLAGLDADGLPVDAAASFSADPACTLAVNDLFSAPANCQP
ncbi:MAG: trypsin-like serine protease, partial [Planctomycetes bacterium]|nr:trypsin-like serine protease [Planctomycetota bacterium]